MTAAEPMPELTTAIRELLAEMRLGVRLVLEGPGRVRPPLVARAPGACAVPRVLTWRYTLI